jgi:hypothetical protein
MVKSTKTTNTKERFETHFHNSLCYIANGSTKKPYSHQQAMNIMLKLIGTHIVDMMKENRHVSIVAIRRVFNFMRLLLHLMQQDPKIQADVDERVKSFMSSPDKRHKSQQPNLMDS